MIPTQLQDPEFRFIILGRESWGKMPREKKWLYFNNYRWDDPVFQLALDCGNNYGVLGGYGGLVIIDFDDKDFFKSLALPSTFTVKSGGKGLPHMYYKLDKPFRKFKILEKQKGLLPPIRQKVLADLQCQGAYVVGPNCVHESGKTYDVVVDSIIEPLDRSSLRYLFREHWKEPITQLPFIGLPEFGNGDVRRIKDMLTIRDILSDHGVREFYGSGNCGCPMHPPSDGNKYNLGVSDNNKLFYCFHTDEGGSVLDLEMHLTGCSLKEAIERLKDKC